MRQRYESKGAHISRKAMWLVDKRYNIQDRSIPEYILRFRLTLNELRREEKLITREEYLQEKKTIEKQLMVELI